MSPPTTTPFNQLQNIQNNVLLAQQNQLNIQNQQSGLNLDSSILMNQQIIPHGSDFEPQQSQNTENTENQIVNQQNQPNQQDSETLKQLKELQRLQEEIAKQDALRQQVLLTGNTAAENEAKKQREIESQKNQQLQMAHQQHMQDPLHFGYQMMGMQNNLYGMNQMQMQNPYAMQNQMYQQQQQVYQQPGYANYRLRGYL